MPALLISLLLTQAPLGVGKLPQPIGVSTSTYPQHILFQTDGGVGPDAIACLSISRGPDWRCLAEKSYVDGATSGLASTAYVNSAVAAGTSGLASTAYVNAAVPVVPRIFLAPAASDPTTSITGATYWNTASKCLKTWNGTTWTPSACPNPSAASMPSFATAPTGTFSEGDMFNDSTQHCTRRWSGSAWGSCLTTEACGTATVTGIALPVGLSTPTSTVTITGAVAGRPCTVSPPTGALLNVGVTYACAITSANTASFRLQGSLGLAIVGGTYTACTHVPW